MRNMVGIRDLMLLLLLLQIEEGINRVRVLLEIEGPDGAQVGVDVGREARDCSCLLLLLLLLQLL